MRLFSILSKKTVYRKLETCTIYFEYKNIGEGVAFDYCKALCKCNIYLKTHNNVNFIDYVYVLSLPQTRNVCTLYYVELEKSAQVCTLYYVELEKSAQVCTLYYVELEKSAYVCTLYYVELEKSAQVCTLQYVELEKSA